MVATVERWVEKSGAKAFFRFLKNDSKSPLNTFADPDNSNRLTSDPFKIDQIFRHAWADVFKRPDHEPPPDWATFFANYGASIRRFENVEWDSFNAQEYHDAAKRMSNAAAAGMDGWSPAELKLLPGRAWADRVPVEQSFVWHQVYPPCYYDAPISMLRKGDGRTPLEHRGITVYAATYRLANNALWARVAKPLAAFAHKNAQGGLPERECVKAALEAQLDFEQAALWGVDMAMVSADYAICLTGSIPTFSST